MSGFLPAGLALFAKMPVPGRVKTRLAPPLSPAEAAAVARACLEDSLERFSRGRDATMTLYLEGTPDNALLALAARRAVPVRPQSPGSLGARLRAALESLLAEGHPCALAIGSDSPTLPQARIGAAIGALRAHDAVLGPTEDGGYYLLGVSRPAWALLEDVPWSTAQVAQVTRQRAGDAGISLAELEAWYDVDDAATLRRALADSDPRSALGVWGARTRT
ncbi:MAG: TIGR04282 family arsenosugar biosynthesis glycosyltransferase [Candidatus Eisenbacteria bacterium]